MKRRGFSFLEVLIALAILAVISASLMPLMSGLTLADHRVRLRSQAWRSAQSGLTALYLGDPAAWKDIESRSRLRLHIDPQTAARDVRWNKLSVTEPESTQAILGLYLESNDP